MTCVSFQLLAAVVAVLALGCTGTIDDASGELDQRLLDNLAGYQTWTKVNSTAYTSAVGAFDINLYVTGDAAAYREIHPDTTSANVTLAAGTEIVREVLGASGEVDQLTVIAKGPAGYDPTLGDWWFAQTDPTGTPLITAGVAQVGRLTACHGCHVPRQPDDYVFGVPQTQEVQP